MTTPELAYEEVKKPVTNFKDLSSPQRGGMNEMQTRLEPLFKNYF
jgi:hypothetical protein